jgi:AraC-type DNA-binding domain-containing proteins
LQILIADEANANDILTMLQYYDQPHWIRDFKRNIGLTPQELLNRYKD